MSSLAELRTQCMAGYHFAAKARADCGDEAPGVYVLGLENESVVLYNRVLQEELREYEEKLAVAQQSIEEARSEVAVLNELLAMREAELGKVKRQHRVRESECIRAREAIRLEKASHKLHLQQLTACRRQIKEHSRGSKSSPSAEELAITFGTA